MTEDANFLRTDAGKNYVRVLKSSMHSAWRKFANEVGCDA